MEWQLILALVIVIPIILIPAMLVWYLNMGGIYAAIREGGRIRVLKTIGRALRTTVMVIVPVGIYAFAIWFSYGHFGWPVAVALAVALPIVLFVPVLVWAVVVSGLYQVVRETMRQRAAVSRRRAARMAEEPVVLKVINNE